MGILENVKYLYPQVKFIQGADIGEWTDDHPLNKAETADAEFDRLFNINGDAIDCTPN